MKPFAPHFARRFAALLPVAFCLLLTVAGCGHPRAVTRPASSLSEKDRDLLDQYERIRVALANDDLRTARVAAGTLSLNLKPADARSPASPLYDPATQLSTAPALDRARQLFRELSAKVIPLADGVQGFYVMTCDLPSGGDWVQRTVDVNNPYMGKAMRDYGEIRTGSK